MAILSVDEARGERTNALVAVEGGLLDAFRGEVSVCADVALSTRGRHALLEPGFETVPSSCAEGGPYADVMGTSPSAHRRWLDENPTMGPLAAKGIVGPIVARVSQGRFSHVIVLGARFPF